MNVKTRRKLLSLASWLDRRALRIRAYVREQTPKRKIKKQEQAA